MTTTLRIKIESQAGFIQSTPLTGSAVVAEKLVRFCTGRCRKMIARALGDPTLPLQISRIDHGLVDRCFYVTLSLTTSEPIPKPNPDAVRRALIASLEQWGVRVDVVIDGLSAAHAANNPSSHGMGTSGGSVVPTPNLDEPASGSGDGTTATQDDPLFPPQPMRIPPDGGTAGKQSAQTALNDGSFRPQVVHLPSSRHDEDWAFPTSRGTRPGDSSFALDQAGRATGEGDGAGTDTAQNVGLGETKPPGFLANPMGQGRNASSSAANVQQSSNGIEHIPSGTNPGLGTIEPAPFQLTAPPVAKLTEQYLLSVTDHILIMPVPYRGFYVVARANDPNMKPGTDISGLLPSSRLAPEKTELLPVTAIVERRLED